MARKIVLFVVVLVAALLTFVVTRPDTFHVERSATVHAPADVVFARLDDFHRWSDWSPWEKLDPAMQRTYSGADKGVGAEYAWKGNDKVGEGRMTIQDAEAPRDLDIKLEFLKPFQATSATKFALAPAEGGTKVTWSMDGRNNFMSKTMSLFMSMDKEVGKDFEKGLAQLDAAATAEAKAAPADSGAAQ